MNTITQCELCGDDMVPRAQISSNQPQYFPHHFQTEQGVCFSCMCTTATLEEFKIHFTATVNRQKNERKGQWAFNCLWMWRPDLSEQIRGSYNLDPFNNDDRLPAFWQFVEENW